ncbi:hypothetical protein HD806DRAFT_510839 [Xylariaceae sp. AK1471]|nr:hypothetical protein HD806DRAFT_510839 [Xylariaceae sp. AK1471]
MLSDTKLYSQITSSAPCSVTEAVLVWNYAPSWLVLSYSAGLGLISLQLSCAYIASERIMNTTFNTFVVATKCVDLHKLVERQPLGYWPVCKEIILDSRIRFGELMVPL